jgi:hypothetical protein
MVADREAKAQDLLSLARKKLEEGQRNRNLDTLSEAKGLAASAAKQFQSLKEEGSSLIAQWQQAQMQAQAQTQNRSAPPEPPHAVPPVPVQVPAPPTARPEKQAEVLSAVPQPSLAPFPSPETSSRKPVPESLLAAVRAYFAADYPLTVKLLEKASFSDRRATAQAFLFRAAARMALYWRGADRETDLLAAAQRDIREGRRLDPGLRVDARAFSPRFRSFVGNLR